ncbi:MAG: hypothetical protein KF912_06630 [Phycisphaeraceae bacterium]|nr:hypothetical protein [Phycisphaeraceae bacterium]MBX3366974.1 hypothetical protein [Phycisphaeraceae bacterium]
MLKCLMLQKAVQLLGPWAGGGAHGPYQFVGLSFADKTPDAETRFVWIRPRLCDAGLHEAISETMVRHIKSQGLLTREVTTIGAPRG